MENNKLDALSRYAEILKGYDDENRFRTIPSDRTDRPGWDLCSNDYLGLGRHWKDFIPSFSTISQDAAMSSSASRLLSARQNEEEKLENLIAALYGKEALLFNSGYHANVGIIQALNIENTIFLTDKLIHASAIDGIAVAHAEYARWRHNDLNVLRRLLEKYSNKQRCIVLVESVYSMDGDLAPLPELVELRNEFPNMLLYVDEAHAFGCFGKKGLGLCEEFGIIQNTDIIVGTLGKAAASAGAFVVCDDLLRNVLVNRARSFIFSTSLPPINHAWSRMMILNMLDMHKERENLKKVSETFRLGLEKITNQSIESKSQIVPLIVGDALKAIHLAARLSSRGIDALAIRHPTVAVGTERIRFSLSADLTKKDIDSIINIIKQEYEG